LFSSSRSPFQTTFAPPTPIAPFSKFHIPGMAALKLASEEGFETPRPVALRSYRHVVLASAGLSAGAAILLASKLATSPSSLAAFRRHTLEKESVELVGTDASVDGFNCFLDVSQATLRLVQVIVLSRIAVTKCADTSDTVGKATCTQGVNLVFYNFALLAAMIALGVSDCSRKLVLPAACAAGVTGIIASLDNLPAATGGIIAFCNIWWESVRVPPTGVTTTKAPLFTTMTRTRKFFTTPAATAPSLPFPTLVPSTYWWNNSQKDAFGRAIVICMCFVGQAILYIGRAAVVILDSTKSCTPENQVGEPGRKQCTIGMFTMMASFSLVAQFLTAAVPSCSASVSDSRTRGSACATNIISVVTAVIASTPVFMKIDKLCPRSLLTSTLAPPALPPTAGAMRLLSAVVEDEEEEEEE